MEGGFVAADHDVVVCFLPRQPEQLHEPRDARLVIDERNAFVLVLPLPIHHVAQDVMRRLLVPSKRNLRTNQRHVHHRLDDQFGQLVEAVFMVDRVAANRKMRFGTLVTGPAGIERRVAVDHDEQFLNQFRRVFRRQRSVHNALLIKRIEILIRPSDAVRQEGEAEIDALHGFFERPRRIHRDLSAVRRHPQQRRLPCRIFAGFRQIDATLAIGVRSLADTVDDALKGRQKLQMAAFAQKLLSRGVDFLHVAVEAQADELAEIRIGMLPFERAEILLRLPVVFCGDFTEFRMARTMEDVGGNRRLVETDMANQFVVVSDHDRLRVVELAEPLRDEHWLRQFFVKRVAFNLMRRRIDVARQDLMHQPLDSFVHDMPMIMKILISK